MKNGWIWRKIEKPCFENFSRVTILDLALTEDEESPWFLEGRNSKYKNGFFNIDSIDQEFSRSIFIFEIGWEEIEILQIEYFGQPQN